MPQTAEAVLVLVEAGMPVQLVWRDDLYMVSDRPTPTTEATWHEALTHPAVRMVGWRFQGTNVSDGSTRVFDVRSFDGEHWELAAVYE